MSWLKKFLPWKKKKDCCSFWPDGKWQDCCCQHDDDYKYGEVTKKQADDDLKMCVIASGYPNIAEMMYQGVCLFGRVAWFNHRRRNIKRGVS